MQPHLPTWPNHHTQLTVITVLTPGTAAVEIAIIFYLVLWIDLEPGVCATPTLGLQALSPDIL